MSRHVAPHRLAAAEAGRLSEADAAAVAAHVAGCARCERARVRVRAARDELDAIGAAEPGDLRWDHIGARVYWVTSSERRSGRYRTQRPRGLPLGAVLVAVAAVAAVVAVVVRNGPRGATTAAQSELLVEPARVTTTAVAASRGAAPLRGVVTFMQGVADADFDRPLSAGDRISTGAGRAVVQFGPDSGFAIGPYTTLEILALDAERIQLSVEGTVDVRVSERRPGQRFSVVAGEHEVVVRGTVFRVARADGTLDVACTRGRVEVVDAVGSTAVRAGEALSLRAGERVLQPLDESELDGLHRAMRIPVLSMWSGADQALAESARLVVEARPGAQVFVDGDLIGAGSFSYRVSAGRHWLGGSDAGSRWLELAAGGEARESLVRPPRVAGSRPPSRAPEFGRALQAREGDVRACAASLRKQGVHDGSFVELELGLDAVGRQTYLNVVDGNVPDGVASCVRDVVGRATFGAGRAERLRRRVTF